MNIFWTRPQSYYDEASWRGTIQLDGGKNYTGNANVGKIAFKFKKAK